MNATTKPLPIAKIREAIRSLYYLRDMLTGGTAEEFARQNVGPDLAAKIAEIEALEIPARFADDIEERSKQIEYARNVITRWEKARASLLDKLALQFTGYSFEQLLTQPASEKLLDAVQKDRLLANCYAAAKPAAAPAENVVAFPMAAPAAPPAPSPSPIMTQSSATLAAQEEFIRAVEAHGRAARAGLHTPAEVAVFLAVSRMASARLKMCKAADELSEASEAHGRALAALPQI